MQEVRRNEFKDLLEMNELMFVESTDFIKVDIPELGSCTYYPKKNRLNIHRGNKWEHDGYYFVKSHLGKSKEKIVVKCTLGIDNNINTSKESVVYKNMVSMNPEWLRKGNLMNVMGEITVVKAYDIYCLEEGMDSMIMQPIPITEEWLVKLSVKNTKQINKSCFCVQYNEKKELYEFCLLLNGGIKICLNTFEFVNQLQNLYFALTGEELTLKT